jgi:DNA-binding CsgD family transcriptional regulator/predicted negative regulator of RcsB-dependent stress response
MSLLPVGVTEPIDSLVAESQRIHRNSPAEAHAIAMRAHDMSVAAGYTAGQAASLFRAAASLRLLGRREEALESCKASEALFAKLKDDAALLRCMNHRASLLRDGGAERDAIILFHEVIAEAELAHANEVMFSAYSGLVSAYEAIGDKLGVLESANKALAVAQSIGNEQTVAFALCNCAGAELEFEHWERAIELFNEALPVLERAHDADTAATALSNIGYAYWRAGNSKSALKAYENAHSFATEHENPRMQLVAESCLGYLFAELKNRTKAIPYIKSSLALSERVDFVAERSQVLMKAADAYVQLNDKPSAIAYYEQALKVTAGFSAVREEICAKLAPLFAEQGDHEQAYRLAVEQLALATERERREREYSIRAVEVRRELQEQREQHLRLIEEKAKLEEQAHARDRELTQVALSLAERYELLRSIREQLLAADGNKRVIIRAIDRHLEASDGWRTFEMQFQSVYGDFSSRLLAVCPELTPTELRVTALLKLGLSSKQIADTLGASPRTVEWHRTSIRKKLRLASNDNLSTFLASIGLANGSTP